MRSLWLRCGLWLHCREAAGSRLEGNGQGGWQGRCSSSSNYALPFSVQLVPGRRGVVWWQLESCLVITGIIKVLYKRTEWLQVTGVYKWCQNPACNVGCADHAEMAAVHREHAAAKEVQMPGFRTRPNAKPGCWRGWSGLLLSGEAQTAALSLLPALQGSLTDISWAILDWLGLSGSGAAGTVI